MNFDLINNVVTELIEQLSGARVSKIYQPSPEVFVFKLWNGGETLRLLISVEGQRSRIHLTQQTWPNPHIPPRFCQLLRARISRINSIQVVNGDRIVQFDCHGKQGDCRLFIELINHRGNMILVDDRGVIVDVLKRVDGPEHKRILLAGEVYRFPDKQGFIAESKSPRSAELEVDCNWNQTVEKVYSNRQYAENKKDFRQQLLHTVHRQQKKLRKRLAGIEKDVLQQKKFDRYRHLGDLLLSNLHLLKPGMESVNLQNYHAQSVESVTVPLDPQLSPQQNAEKYFRRYKKLKRGQEHSERRLKEARTELEWLEQLDYQLQDDVRNSDIEEVAEELRSAGILKEQNNLHKKRTLQPSKPHETLSPSGLKIVWGRNNRQNDEISIRRAKAGDVWFHARNIPGAHVLLQVPAGSTVTEEDTWYAAALAAGYSRARNDSKVEVIMTDAKFIHKPASSRAGLVTVSRYKTLLVKPFRLD